MTESSETVSNGQKGEHFIHIFLNMFCSFLPLETLALTVCVCLTQLLETGRSRLRRCRTAVSRTECYSSCSLETFDCNSYIITINNSSSTIYTINSKSLHSSYSTCNRYDYLLVAQGVKTNVKQLLGLKFKLISCRSLKIIVFWHNVYIECLYGSVK